MRIRAIFFDLDDTLLDDTISSERSAALVAAELASDRGVEPEDLAAAYMEAAMNFWERLEPGVPKPPSGAIRPSIWRNALRARGIDDPDLAKRLAARYDEVRLERVELFPETVPVLHQLHGRFKLAIITNGFAETHEAKIARLELARFFDSVVLAGEMELAKPDPAIFRHAMESVHASPDESVMVGDRFKRDIIGAHAAGMRAIWLNSRDESLPHDARPPEAIISSLADLPRAIVTLDADEQAKSRAVE